MAPNRPEWAWADLGIMTAGGRTVPIYHTEELKTIGHILNDSQNRFLFTHSIRRVEELLTEGYRSVRLTCLQAVVDRVSFRS